MLQLDEELPAINRRIGQLIISESGGNTSFFATMIGHSSQKIQRLLKPDPRNKEVKKFPEPTIEVVQSIASTFGLSTDWIIRGESPDDDMSGISIKQSSIGNVNKSGYIKEQKAKLSVNEPNATYDSKNLNALQNDLTQAKEELKQKQQKIDELTQELLKSKDMYIKLLQGKDG